MGALAMAVHGTGDRKAVPQEENRGRQYLTFTLGGDLYACPIANIKEIIEFRTPTDVPMMPPFIRGVINLRGRVVPVIDLSVRFGRGKAQATRRSCIVILEVRQGEDHHDIGAMVDAVNAVLEIADADVEPPPSFGARIRNDFVSGMGKVGERFVIILDTGRVLSIDELSLLGGLAGGDGEPQA